MVYIQVYKRFTYHYPPPHALAILATMKENRDLLLKRQTLQPALRLARKRPARKHTSSFRHLKYSH